MAKNENLHKAKCAKNDEFYTQRGDIEAELCHYAEHFRDKVVYCNCDDPVTSEFWRFFVRNFKPWNLKKLMATHYEPNEKNYSYSLEICEDTNGDGRIDFNDEPTVKQLPCNGDFRSAACIELLKEADIVVTNPPFSLFREYIAQLMEYRKKFVIIGNMNAITYKEFFPLLQNDLIWIGFNNPKEFATPVGTLQKFGNICWFTNLDIPKRHEPLDLRGNYYHGNEEHYPHYDNYNAIEVSKTSDIPSDYEGVMGVPVSFLDKYCPEQFNIIGLLNSSNEKLAGIPLLREYDDFKEITQDGRFTKASGKKTKGNPVLRGQSPKGNYYIHPVTKECVYSTYARILIRHKKGDNQ